MYCTASKCWTPSASADDSFKQKLPDLEWQQPSWWKAFALFLTTSTPPRCSTLKNPDSVEEPRCSSDLRDDTADYFRWHEVSVAKQPNDSQLSCHVKGDYLNLRSSVLCSNMKQLSEMTAGNSALFARGRRWKNFFALMGCWWRWASCCNPGGQRSQLSWCSKPCQLDAPRPWEPPGPQGHQPDKGFSGWSTDFPLQLLAEQAFTTEAG